MKLKNAALLIKCLAKRVKSPCVTPLRSYTPRLQQLLSFSKRKKLSHFGLRYPVIRDCAAPVSSQESTTQLLNNVYNASQDWRLCVKTACRSACQTLWNRSGCPLHKVLWFFFPIHIAQMSFCSCAGRGEGGEWLSCRTVMERFWKIVSVEESGEWHRSSTKNVECFNIFHLQGAGRDSAALIRHSCTHELWHSGPLGTDM